VTDLHEPYVASEPPVSNDIQVLRDWLSYEFKRIESGFNGVDLEQESRYQTIEPNLLPRLFFEGIIDRTADPVYEVAYSAGGSIITDVHWFDGTTAAQSLYFNVRLPSSFKEGSIILPRVRWTHNASATASEVVVWGINYQLWHPGSAIPAHTNALITATCNVTPDLHLTHAFPEITASAAVIGTILAGHIYRDPTASTDTWAKKAGLLGFEFNIEIDSVGSNTDTVK